MDVDSEGGVDNCIDVDDAEDTIASGVEICTDGDHVDYVRFETVMAIARSHMNGNDRLDSLICKTLTYTNATAYQYRPHGLV